MVDLGAGDCCKALAWLPFLAPTRYLAVDIARQAIADSLAKMAPEYPEIEMLGIVADFVNGLDLEQDLDASGVTFFYPGSSIGNFTPTEALSFLRSIKLHCAGRDDSGLLIGVDTKKDKARLDAAYDDAVGVTAAFNRNVLTRMNRELGADFDADAFAHYAFYEPVRGRIEMHLVSLRRQEVTVSGQRFRFADGESIHTECSYKYDLPAAERLARSAGLHLIDAWLDDARRFAVLELRPVL